MSVDTATGDVEESCDNCAGTTPHQVQIKIRTESDKNENTEFSREPYRVTECLSCGQTTSQRMNNA
ncbi:hypothetical protein [Halomicrococcus sp. NG-SE-24]|uniref:DUF7835 family putative zinc beta-ribbon protein n=1 Tax=Halomicrococcus sp. NG-SE-24 TaxID=3436928 RepID=UPI003D98C7A2